MFIKQVSVFLENRVGALRELTSLLGANGMDIRELSVADTQNFGIIRMIFRSDIMDSVVSLLKESGYTARVNRVICAEIGDKAGGLGSLLEIVEKGGLSVEYMYSFRRTASGNVLMVLRLSDQEKGVQVLKDAGIVVHSQDEADKF